MNLFLAAYLAHIFKSLSPSKSRNLLQQVLKSRLFAQDIKLRIGPRKHGEEVPGSETALEIVDRAVELGMLPPAPADRSCSMCDFLCVCGPDQERRGNRKSKKELADVLELRGRP